MKNNINSKFFLYSLKKNLYFILFNLIVFIVTFIVPILMMYSDYKSPTKYINFDSKVVIVAYALMVYTFIVPIKSFAYLSKKRTIDAYYSLPIERNKVGHVNLLSDVISVIAPFTVVYFSGSLITLILYNDVIYIYYLILYVLLVIFFVLCTIINSFFYTRCHRILDSLANMFMANYVFAIIVDSIANLLYQFKFSSYLSFYGDTILSSVFTKLSSYFNNLISIKYNYQDYLLHGYLYPNANSFEEYFDSFISFNSFPVIILVVILASLCLLLYKILSKKDKPENAEERSESWFGLKIMTPIVFTGLILNIVTRNFSNNLTFFIIIGLGYFVLTLLEFRTFKIPLYRVLMLAGMFMLMIIFTILINMFSIQINV